MLIYILLRIFTDKRKYVEGDELRHMACAKNFYKLWNKSLYDTHPPLYSFLIKCLTWLGYYRAGVIVSFLCSIGLYVVCGRLYDFFGITPFQKSVALACLAFNYTLIYYSNKAFRYQLIALLGVTMLYALLTQHHIIAGLLWGLLGLTCTYAGLRGFWIWLISPHLASLGIFILIYGSWLGKKINVYSQSMYYPAGIDGKIEPMNSLNFKRLISPLYFPWTYSYYGKRELGYDLKSWFRKIGGMYGVYQTKHRRLNILLYIITGLMILLTIKGMMSSPFSLVILTLILLYPSLLKRFLPRNSMMAIPLMCYFVAKGVPQANLQGFNLAIGGGVVLFLYFNRVFMLSKPKIKARLTSMFLDRLASDSGFEHGILSEGLIAYPIVYRCRQRIVVIPHDPDPILAEQRIKLSVEEFDLKYVVFSELWKTEEHLGYPAIQYIKDNYTLLKTILEDNDKYYIYEISTN